MRTHLPIPLRHRSRSHPGTIMLGLALAAGAAIAGPDDHTLIDLGSLTGRGSNAFGLNELGQVVGSSAVTGRPGMIGGPAAEPFKSQFFVAQLSTGMVGLGAIDDPSCGTLVCRSKAWDINDNGLIVGWSSTQTLASAVVYAPQAIPELGLDAGFNLLPRIFTGTHEATGINNAGIICGEARGGPNRRPVRWIYNGIGWILTDLGTHRADNTGAGGATAINELGQIVGEAQTEDGGLAAFLWLPEPAYGLPEGMHQLGPRLSRAEDINDKGQIVGRSGVNGQPFLWLPAPDYGLPAGYNLLPKIPLPGRNFDAAIHATGINNHGEIVGTAIVPNDDFSSINPAGVRWNGSAWTFLDDDLPPNAPWSLTNLVFSANINDAGEISGTMQSDSILDIFGGPSVHAYLLKPSRCPADLTTSADPNDPSFGLPDGILDASDFFYYLDRFAAGDLIAADLTGSINPNDPGFGIPDGSLDANDFFFYLDLFAAGCP